MREAEKPLLEDAFHMHWFYMGVLMTVWNHSLVFNYNQSSQKPNTEYTITTRAHKSLTQPLLRPSRNEAMLLLFGIPLVPLDFYSAQKEYALFSCSSTVMQSITPHPMPSAWCQLKYFFLISQINEATECNYGEVTLTLPPVMQQFSFLRKGRKHQPNAPHWSQQDSRPKKHLQASC